MYPTMHTQSVSYVVRYKFIRTTTHHQNDFILYTSAYSHLGILSTYLSCPILSYPVHLSYPIPSYPILSNPILSYPILSYPILSCHLQTGSTMTVLMYCQNSVDLATVFCFHALFTNHQMADIRPFKYCTAFSLCYIPLGHLLHFDLCSVTVCTSHHFPGHLCCDVRLSYSDATHSRILSLHSIDVVRLHGCAYEL